MSETTSYQEPDISGNAVVLQKEEISVPSLGWGLFGRFIFANAGTLFLLAGIICFFAYNWEDLSPFAKFGIIGAAMLAAAAFPLFRGINSTAGSLGLLACGILGGALMAVYGQVYQTGANAWELFRSWAIFLIPLTLFGRQAGLWFTLWMVSSLWGVFYLGQRVNAPHNDTAMANILLYQCLAQTAFFVLWEAAARFFSGPRFPFLNTRWLPRVIGVALLAFLTFMVSLIITKEAAEFGHPVIYSALYLALMAGGAFYYRTRQTDLFMVAAGLFSLIMLVLTFIIHHLKGVNITTIFFATVVVLLVGSAISGKLLIARYRKWRESIRQQREKAQEKACIITAVSETAVSETPALPAGFSLPLLRLALQGRLPRPHLTETDEEPDAPANTKGHTPWQARLLMGICAWIAVPCMIALIFTLTGWNLDQSGYSIVFLILLGIGIGLTWLPGVFFEQAALCLCLTGASAAGVLISMEIGNRQLCLLPAIILFAASAFPARNNAYRFLAAALAITMLFFQADLFFFPLERGHYRYLDAVENSLPDVSIPMLVVFGVIYAACAVGLTHVWRKFTQNGALVLQRHPFVAAFYAVPLFLGIFSVLFHSSKILMFLSMELGMSGVSIKMAGIGAAAGLGYLVFQLAKDLDIHPSTRIIMAGLSIPVAIVSWYMPWFGIGLLMLAMSRQAKSMVLLGTATFFLSVCTVLEYYALSTTLLIKSLSLGGIGIFLLLSAVALHRYMTHCLRNGTLHLPASLVRISPSTVASGKDDVTTVSARKNRFGQAILSGCILVFFLFFGYAVQQKEQLLENGERVILALRPVDPRSLMQGDYMTLSLEIENAIYQALRAEKSPENELDAWLKGTIIAAPDETGVYHFVRLDDGTTLQPAEVRLIYRGKRFGSRVGSGSFFFQEGYGKIFERARFVELRAGKDGETLITHLLDENRQRINPKEHLAKDPR